jgi:type VI secretion system protein ImpF
MSESSSPGVALSFLDRLMSEPLSGRTWPLNPWEEVRAFKSSLSRDLAALLNTRRLEDEIDPAFEQTKNSVLTFGITDFTSYNLKNGIEQERVRRSIERAIRQFEPRLTRVTVSIEPVDPLRPMLRFQIEALLRIESSTEPILFDVTLHRDTRRMSVAGA